jgi:hypothetical protein
MSLVTSINIWLWDLYALNMFSSLEDAYSGPYFPLGPEVAKNAKQKNVSRWVQSPPSPPPQFHTPIFIFILF